MANRNPNRYSTDGCNELLLKVERLASVYRQNHPSTAEMDLAIIRAYCAGKNAVRISMEIPCAESTVYRSIRRVKDFLNRSEADAILNLVRQQISDQPFHYDGIDANSVLEMMYEAYADYNSLSPETDQFGFRELRALLSGMPHKPADDVFHTVCDLCISHERWGFTEGLKLGVHLADELRN